jgi:hypothetical protein
MKKDQCVPVTTLRCPKCGYLESYAVQATLSDRELSENRRQGQ